MTKFHATPRKIYFEPFLPILRKKWIFLNIHLCHFFLLLNFYPRAKRTVLKKLVTDGQTSMNSQDLLSRGSKYLTEACMRLSRHFHNCFKKYKSPLSTCCFQSTNDSTSFQISFHPNIKTPYCRRLRIFLAWSHGISCHPWSWKLALVMHLAILSPSDDATYVSLQNQTCVSSSDILFRMLEHIPILLLLWISPSVSS